MPDYIQALIVSLSDHDLPGLVTWASHRKWLKRTGDYIYDESDIRWKPGDKEHDVTDDERNMM